jgi:cell division protease FtsH
MAAKIDKQVENIVNNSFEEAKKILINNRETLDKIAEALLEKETLYEDEFKEIISQEK